MTRVHFMGIGGSGISGVAKLAEKMGYGVTGCDVEKNTAYSKNIFQGHDKSHIKNADLVVVTPAVLFSDKKIEEVEDAKNMMKLMTWQEFLGKVLLKQKKLICIAGTHGKSTTTAMAAKLLIDAGFDPTVIIGAVVPEWNSNSRFGRGEYAIVEADEFNNNFLNYHPEIAIINNIEFDHPDFFKNEEEVEESFDKFKENLIGQKILITEKDSLNKKFNLKVFGEHNQKNANMVFLLGKALGIPEDKITKSIEEFNGIGRRMELISDNNNIKIYDDYAHHPTAIATTLLGVKEKYPNSKILAIVEPHGYKRTKAFLSKYKGVFKDADKVIIGPIFKARDEIDKSVSPELIAKISGHKDVLGVSSFDKVIENCKLIISNYDIVIVMGAGKSYLWAREIADLISVKFSDITAFRIGGKVDNYLEVKNKEEVKKAVSFAKDNNLQVFILGDGTDILVSDKEFSGLVIKYIGKSFSINEDGTIESAAGMNWDELVGKAVEAGLNGIEALSGIPGTAGAAPIQNIGAYGAELKDTFISLEAYDIQNEKFVKFTNKDCDFGYRDSIFKKKDHWQKYIICSITLKLSKNKPEKVSYESLKNYISKENPSLSEIRNAILKVRSEKLEDPKLVGNAGSFFKNPIIDLQEKSKLEEKFPEIKTFPFEEKFKISAAWLIEKCNWKGKTYKNAAVSAKHALILINPNEEATAKEVLELSEKISEDVYNRFGIKLEREVQLINF
ncbi:MAG TPA: UDP-N-acetylmuramate dehydrogenase [Patescibacteria group bacterium]|nr:UDP-N-acetylmuramate dehydrogenase [Patescibacteria group bacterium]